MKSPQTQIQKAIYDRLTTELTCPVYDSVPQNMVMPYISLGDTTTLNWGTALTPGTNNSFTIHVWSQYNGWKEAKDIASNIVEALAFHDLAYAGYSQAWDLELDTLNGMRDPDGKTRHLILVFRVKLQEV